MPARQRRLQCVVLVHERKFPAGSAHPRAGGSPPQRVHLPPLSARCHSRAGSIILESESPLSPELGSSVQRPMTAPIQRPTPNAQPGEAGTKTAESLDSNHSASDLIPFPKSTVSIPNLRTARSICAQGATNFRTDCPMNAPKIARTFQNQSPRMGRWTLDVGRWALNRAGRQKF